MIIIISIEIIQKYYINRDIPIKYDSESGIKITPNFHQFEYLDFFFLMF